MRAPLALILVSTVLLAAPQRGQADEEGEDLLGPVPWRIDADTVFLRRIVEAATGKPVAGATVKLFCEVPHPEPGFGTPAATGTSGPDGWVRRRKADVDQKIATRFGQPTWAYVEAPGLRPDAAYQGTEHTGDERFAQPFTLADPDWPLPPATTLRVALRDPLDRPVVGALVGWLLGCGHTPDVRQARTGPDGLAVLERVGFGGFGHIWPLVDGLQSRYVEGAAYAAWERPRTARLDWSMTVEGTVLGPDEKPAAGVAVGHANAHRGPWTRTDAMGRFRLVGSDATPEDGVVAEVGEYPVGPASAPKPGLVTSLTFPAPPAGHRAVVRLPKPGQDLPEEAEDGDLSVEVARNGWPKARVRPAVRVLAVRKIDGWTARASFDEKDIAHLHLRAGTYTIDAAGCREGYGVVYSRAYGEVTVSAAANTNVRIEMPPPALQPLDIDWPESAPFFDAVEVITDGATTPIPNEAHDGRHVELLLPTDQDVALRVTQVDRSRTVSIDRKHLRAGERASAIHVSPFAPVEVRARFADAEGQPADGWLIAPSAVEIESPDRIEMPKSKSNKSAAISVLEGEHVVLVAWPADALHLQPRFVELARLVADGKPLDLGEVRFPVRAPVLSVAEADGSLTNGGAVLVTKADRAEDLWSGEAVEGVPAGVFADPWYARGLLANGALVRVPAWSEHGDAAAADTHDVPFVSRLDGPGPWAIRLPAGSLAIDVRDDASAPMAGWVAYLDGRRFAAKGSAMRLDAIQAGPHEVVVDAPGRTPRRLSFVLAEGEHRSWSARLRPAGTR